MVFHRDAVQRTGRQLAVVMATLSLTMATAVGQFSEPKQSPNVAPEHASSGAATPAAKGSSEGVRAQLESIHTRAQQATRLSELTELIQHCLQLKEQSLSEADLSYLNRLAGWLFNRRGEAVAQEATRQAEAGDEAQAIRLQERALQDFSASLELAPHWRVDHNRGVSHAMVGRYDEAIAAFSAAISREPTNTSSRFNRAELLLELGRHDEAMRDYAAVLAESPEDVAALLGRAHSYFYLGQFDKAILDLDQVIRQEPENALAYADRADLYAYLGQWDHAARDYRMAIRTDKSLGRAYQSVAWLMATCPDEKYRDVQLAIRAAERAIELDGQDDYRYLDTLAAAQANANQFQDAEQTVQDAIKSAPETVVEELQERLTLYQAQKPFRDAIR